MKKVRNLGLILLLTMVVACQQSSKIKLPHGEAYFSSVSYKGSDSYYDQHPLKSNHFYNPILPGFYPDPSICQKGDDFYLVNSTFSFFPGVPIFHSTDLVNWEQIGHVLDRPSQFKNLDQPVSAGIYAASINYNPHNDTFYMVTTFVGGGGNFVVTAKNPAGPWSEPYWLSEVPGIDPSLFFDEDGRAYLSNNQYPEGGSLYSGHTSIWIQEFDVETNTMVGPRKMIRNGGHNLAEKPVWIEGPHIYKKDGFYFLMAAEGGTGIHHSEVVFKSKDIWGPYKTNTNNPILTQRDLDSNRDYPITNAGHADLFRTSSGKWYAVFLACRPYTAQNDINIGRETFLLPVDWGGEWPIILERGLPIPMQLENTELVTKEIPEKAVMPHGNFSWEEKFDKDVLGFDWFFLRTPQEQWYELPKEKDGIMLKLRDVNLRELKQPSFLAHRQQHRNMTLETKLSFMPQDSTELAGLALFQNEAYHFVVGVTKCGEDICIVVQKAQEDVGIERQLSADGNKGSIQKVILAKKVLESGYDGSVILRVAIQNGKISFASNTRGKWETLISGLDATYLSTNKAGGFIGTVMGLYASSNE